MDVSRNVPKNLGVKTCKLVGEIAPVGFRTVFHLLDDLCEV